jgi:hypothetical protein
VRASWPCQILTSKSTCASFTALSDPY